MSDVEHLHVSVSHLDVSFGEISAHISSHFLIGLWFLDVELYIDCMFSSQICWLFLPEHMATQLHTFPNILLFILFFSFCKIDMAATVQTLDTPGELAEWSQYYLDYLIKQRLPINTDCCMKVK